VRLEELKRVEGEALKDSYLFSKGIAGFTGLTPEEHLDLCRFLDSIKSGELGCIIAPRGTYKTSIMTGKALQLICRNPNIRILYVCKTFKAASGTLREMLMRLEGAHAPLLWALWGKDLVPKVKKRWSSEAFEVNRTMPWPEATVEAAGIRTNKTRFHYDVVILDDIVAPDKDEIVKDRIELRREDLDRANGFIQLSSDLLDKQGLRLIFFITTRWAENDPVSFLRNWPNVRFFDKPAYRPDGSLNYPNLLSEQRLEKLRKQHSSYLFHTLYLNKPFDPKKKPFKTSYLQHYAKCPKRTDMYITITVDPASGKVGRDETAIMVAGTHRETGRIFVLDYVYEHIGALETVKKTLDLAEKWNPALIAFEATQYQSTLEELLRRDQRKRAKRWVIKPMYRTASKSSRILSLQGFVENADIYIRPYMDELVDEMDSWGPAGSLSGRDHLLDCLADHVALASEASRGPVKSIQEGSEEHEACAIAVASDKDNSFIIVLGRQGSSYCIIDSDVRKMSAVELEESIKTLLDKYKSKLVGCAVEPELFRKVIDPRVFDGVKARPVVPKDKAEVAAEIDKGVIRLSPNVADLRANLLHDGTRTGIRVIGMAKKILKHPEGVKVWVR